MLSYNKAKKTEDYENACLRLYIVVVSDKHETQYSTQCSVHSTVHSAVYTVQYTV